MSAEATESSRSSGLSLSNPPLSTTSQSAATPSVEHRAILAGVVACFSLSGFAALLYQTAWLRQFSLVFGSSELAVAAVLASYMGGMAAGAGLAGRYARRVRRPLLAYAFLQAGIALSALVVPLLVTAAGSAYTWAFGDLPAPPDGVTLGQPLFNLSAAFVVLAIPAGLMGAALPLLIRYIVRRDTEITQRVALLFSAKTVGAAAGTVVAAFVLLPALGLKGTVWVGVAVNTLVLVIAVVLARKAVATRVETPALSAAISSPAGFFGSCLKPLLLAGRGRTGSIAAAFRQQPAWILPLMLLSGANAFLYEMLWTRLLSHVIGGSLYAFATMLAAFLTGIALGSALIGKVAATKVRATAAFAVAQVAIALLSIGVYAWMQALIPETRSIGQFIVYAGLVMLPATIFIGATFPLAVRMLAENEWQVSAATGRIYACNMLGAIVGAVLAGFYVIPALGFEGSIKLAVLVNLVLALWSVVFVQRVRLAPVGVAAALLVLVALVYEPGRPDAVIASTAFPVPEQDRREVFFAPGRSATVLLSESDGALELRTNGLPEASVLLKGAPPIGQVQHWVHALPIAARPDASTMMVIGFGGGVALEDVPPSIRAIDVVELEPEVIRANEVMGGLRIADPLADPRINIVINDPRNALQLTSKRYDLIVSQSSHPWTRGSSHLFSREFAALAKSRLNEDGVFLQSIGGEFVDGDLLQSLTATLLDVYSNVRLYQSEGRTLFFLASDAAIDIESEILRTGRPLNANLLHYSYLGLNGADDFVTALVLDEEGSKKFSAGAPLSTDDRNRMATHSRMHADGLEPAELAEVLAPYDPLLDKEGDIREGLSDRLNFAYIASRLIARGQTARATRLAATIDDVSTRALITALVRAANGEMDAARDLLRTALRENPRNMAARFTLLEPELPALATGQASAEAVALAEALTGPAAAVVRGWIFAATRDLDRLANLDQELARSNVTDLWFPHATQLRADWRTQASGDSRHAFDAMRMLDRAIVIRPSIDLYVQRAAAVDKLGDALAFTETSRYTVRYLHEYLDRSERIQVPISDAELAVTGRRLDAWQSRLGELRAEAGDRVAEVFDQMGALLYRYETIARARGLVGE